MKIKFSTLIGNGLLLSLVLAACAIPGTGTNVTPPVQTEPPVVSTEVTGTSSSQPPAQDTVSAPVQHLTQPGTPVYIDTQAIRDCIMVDTTGVPVLPLRLISSCDKWDINLVERPVSADLNTYYPYLDIESAQFGATVDWIFARIKPVELVAKQGDSDLTYFLELDLNSDNLGDVLISVQNLGMSDVIWTTNNVRAWKFSSNGIVQIFDQGIGTDPDMAWVRRTISNEIEFAFKPALLEGDVTFVWSIWSFQGTFDPALVLPVHTFPDSTYQMDDTCIRGFNISAFGLRNSCP